MEDTLDVAARILESHPSPAVPYTELHTLVAREASGPPPDPERMLQRIRARPDRFRIVDSCRGPWRSAQERPFRVWACAEPVRPGEARATVREAATVREPAPSQTALPLVTWIVPGPSCNDAYSDENGFMSRLRRTLHHLGQRIDVESTASLTRWSVMVWEANALNAAWRNGQPAQRNAPLHHPSSRTSSSR